MFWCSNVVENWNHDTVIAKSAEYFRACDSSGLARSLLLGVLVIAVTFAALPWLPVQDASAAWQTGQVTVGEDNSGSTSYTVQKQSITAAGYDFVMPFGLAQMDNGQIIMTASLETNTTHMSVASWSSDGGNTWTPFQNIAPVENRPTMLTYLGAGNLSLFGTGYFSSDYGHTWTIQGTIDQNYVANEGNAAVDRNSSGTAVRVSEIGYNLANGYPANVPSSLFRYSLTSGKTWQAQITPSAWTFQDTYNGQTYTWATNEGSLVRAANGWLVAALRTDPPSRYSVPASNMANDNLDGTAVSISQDNGQTWSPLNRLFDAGRMHANLQRLPNGNLLMTMVVRHDMQFGGGLASNQQGEDALISTDNGLTWNLDHRISVDAFTYNDPNAPYDSGQCGHIATAVLSDGSVLTAYSKYLAASAVLTKFNPAAFTEFGPITGDFNQDGHVTSADIQSMMGALTDKQVYETSHNNMSDNDFIKLADLNHDGAVNNADLQSLLVLLKSGGGSTEPVPEPTTVTLLACGASVLLLCRTHAARMINQPITDTTQHHLTQTRGP